jgi:hypothetical protein
MHVPRLRPKPSTISHARAHPPNAQIHCQRRGQFARPPRHRSGRPRHRSDDLPDLDEVEASGETIVNLLKRTRCTDLEIVKWYGRIINDVFRRKEALLIMNEQRNLVLLYYKLVLSHAHECVRIGTHCFGAKHDKDSTIKVWCLALKEVMNKKEQVIQ